MNSRWTVILLAVLVLFNRFSWIKDINRTEKSAGDCETILLTVQTSQRQLDKLDLAISKMALEMELRHHKLLENVENIISNKINLLDKQIKTSYSKIIEIENIISHLTSRIDGKVDAIQFALNNVSDTLFTKKTCCQVNVDTTGFVKNITTRIYDIIEPNLPDKLHEVHENDVNVSTTIRNTSNQNDNHLESTMELTHNVSAAINTTKEVNESAPSKCDRSQQEECCTVAVVGRYEYTVYTEMSARGRHTVVNMTSAGLQEYTMYFAVRGVWVNLLLTPSSPVHWSDLYYRIVFSSWSDGHIYIWEQLPHDSEKKVKDAYTLNVISTEHYTYYYVTVSGDTLEVGRRGEPPLLKHTNTELNRLKYFSFGSLKSEENKAVYDCTAE